MQGGGSARAVCRPLLAGEGDHAEHGGGGTVKTARPIPPPSASLPPPPQAGEDKRLPAYRSEPGKSPLLSPERQITHIGVGFAFPAEIANLTMARHKVDVIAIRPKLAGDRGDQIVEIALGKVRAADRAFE
jgi:hypothetical protein